MSQHDTHLFSVRRPRETLGGLNQNTSSIPQPASALKRSQSISGLNQSHSSGYAGPSTHHRSISGSRASLAPPRTGGQQQQPSVTMFQRSSSGSNLADLNSSVKRSSQTQMTTSTPLFPPTSSRKPSNTQHLLEPSSVAVSQRRSSIWQQPRASSTSFGAPPPTPHASFFAQPPPPPSIPRDPRPLRDRNYHAHLGSELLDYLTMHQFELAMRHSLTSVTMKSPTQKDFNCIFQWLYHRIDPSYRFMKSIEQEVPPLLKLMRYPFERSITKSQIAAVGGQNWSTFLALLHWMMQLAVMLERYAQGAYEGACAEAGFDVSGDRIIFGFLSRAYHDWLLMGDEGDAEGGGSAEEEEARVVRPHVERMAAEFAEGNRRYLEELALLEAEHRALEEQVAEMERAEADVQKLEKHREILEGDKREFEAYNEGMAAKAEKYEGRVRALREQIDGVDEEVRQAETERDALRSGVEGLGIEVGDIDRMIGERERLQKGVEGTVARLDEARRKATEREADARARLDSLEREIERYNALGYGVGIIPSSGRNATGEDHELVLSAKTPDALSLSSATSSALRPQDILQSRPVTSTRPRLQQLRTTIQNRRTTALEADAALLEMLSTTAEALEDKRTEVEALEHRVRLASEEFDKLRENVGTARTASEAQVERMERELSRMREGVRSEGEGWEGREVVVAVEYERLVLRADALREELHTQVERMLNDVIRFKVHVQERIEGLDGFVVGELEAELGHGAFEDEADDVGVDVDVDGDRKSEAGPEA